MNQIHGIYATRVYSVTLAVLLSCLCNLSVAANPEGAKLGVIRWDAWVGDMNTDPVGAAYAGLQVERSLGPLKYHNRLPFYGAELSSTAVQARATTQAIMNAELAYANSAGIDFWAFVYYPPGSGLDLARNLYLSSSTKGDVKYSIILGTYQTYAFNEIVTNFTNGNYQRVLGNRPLVFIFADPNSAGYTRAQIDSLRSLAASAGVANPYVVVLHFEHSKASAFASDIGADAISAYVTYRSGGDPYNSLALDERAKWNWHAGTGKKTIPWVTTGWDPRPRIDNPVTWISYASNAWTQAASAAQIREQLRAATDWVATNPSTAEAAAVLMYAWNEFDEGGWVCPTLGDGTERIGALADVMRFSASSTWDESQTPRKAFDGSLATAWQAASGSTFAGQWLEVDFGEESAFSQVYLSEFGNRTGNFRIQYKTGNVWRDAYVGSGIGSGRTIGFATVVGTRARVLFSSGASTPIIYEFQVNNVPAPNPNLAQNKAYYASSQWAGGSQHPALAFDGNLSTNWQAANGSRFSDQWLEVSFGKITTFNSVSISEYGNRTGSYRVEYWANGWKTAYTGSGIGANRQISFPSVTGTGARIRFLSGSYTPIIYEWGVYFR